MARNVLDSVKFVWVLRTPAGISPQLNNSLNLFSIEELSVGTLSPDLGLERETRKASGINKGHSDTDFGNFSSKLPVLNTNLSLN